MDRVNNTQIIYEVMKLAKSNQLFRALLGIGGAVAAVVLSKKENRDKLKNEINKYKENPDQYKQRAQEKASQVGGAAAEEFQKVKKDPKSYVNEVKEDPKSFLADKKETLLNPDKKEEKKERVATFIDEGGGDPSNNLHESTEEKLKEEK